MHITTASSLSDGQNLSGEWRFALDPQNIGCSEKWFANEIEGKVRLPGDLSGQGIGDAITPNTPWTGHIVDRSYFDDPAYACYRELGNIKVPFWLQPACYYAGAAWYQRDIDIPTEWENCTLRLRLERPHGVTRAWLDEREIGSQQDSLSTPHEYCLGASVAAGRHRLTILVDNLRHLDVGPNSHSITDHTQGNWNGIVGRIELQALGPAWIDDLRIYPDAENKSIVVRGKVEGVLHGNVELKIGDLREVNSLNIQPSTVRPMPDGTFDAEILLGPEACLWDEFTPTLYVLTATPDQGTPKISTFGLRTIGRAASQLTLNGRKLFLRGALDCAIFPKTGHPPTDVDSWKRVFATIKEWGLNHIRYHSWCPTEAAFAAADELGVYLQVECSSWANTTTSLGDGEPIDDWIYDEATRILNAYGNHPSFLLMAYGNEPGGENQSAYLSKWVAHFKAADPRRFYTSAAGWPVLPESDFHNVPEPRIQIWFQGLSSRVNAFPPETAMDYTAFNEKHYHGTPVVSHESGEWCAYPNFDEIPKYTGHLKPKNFEIFRETLDQHHMADQARAFVTASGRHQVLTYKEEIESALRTTNMSGFQLLGLQDYSGQGPAPVGVLDAFWEPKGYVTAQEYRRFCNVTVPLARLPKRVFTTDEKLSVAVEVAHFGQAPLAAAPISWRLVSESSQVVAQGTLPSVAIPVNNGTQLGVISIDLETFPAPRRYRLVVSLDAGRIENDWDIWIYPKTPLSPVPSGILVTRQLDHQALSALAAGGSVAWLIPPGTVANDPNHPIVFGFSPIFWSTAWTKMQPPTTLGILCDPQAPALAQFPTDSHSNWHWWYPIQKAQPMILDGLPPALRPIVQVIDDWFTNRRLGLVFEARLGKGKLLVSSIDFDQPSDPVTAQLRHSLLAYMASDAFQPVVELTHEQLRSLTLIQPNLRHKPSCNPSS